jgi:hypothetical protein
MLAKIIHSENIFIPLMRTGMKIKAKMETVKEKIQCTRIELECTHVEKKLMSCGSRG